MESSQFDLAAFLQLTSDKLNQYFQASQKGEGRVLQQLPANQLAEMLRVSHWIKHGGLSLSAYTDLLDTYLANTQHLHHPSYIGHQVSVPHPIGGVSGLINGIVSNPMGIYEMGPSAATIERVIINWLLDKVGWFKGADWSECFWKEGSGGGVLTHGGSMANLTAMSAARAAIAPEAWSTGTPPNLVVLAPAVAHYSIARAISIMGMGKQAIIPVPVDKQERLRPETLATVYKKVKEEGKQVMAVVANACATATGLYDPLDEVGDFCEANDLWYHIDGAHGAAALLAKEEIHLMKGAQRATSLIWDAHKMLQVESLCAAVLYKDYQHLETAFQQKGSYLFHPKEELGFDTLPFTIECTKAGLGARLFWTVAVEGEKGMGDYVHHQYQLTRQFYDIIHSHPDFHCPYYPEANILCFEYQKFGRNNDLQLAIRNEVVKRGHFYITSSDLQGVRHLRLTVMNQLTTTEHIQQLLKEIIQVAAEVMKPKK